MDLFFTFTLTLIFIYLIIIWVCPKLLSWIFGLKYQVRVTIGYIRIPYLRLKDVNISRDGISMHIDELYLSSSLFNSEVSKLFAFIAHDVRFNKVDPLSQNKKIKMSIQEHVLYLQSIKLPSFLVTVGPFMSILLTNISAMWAGSSGWFIHTTADEIKLEGNSSTRSNGLGIKTLIKQAKTRICKRLSPNNANLAEICYTINSNMTLTKLCPDKLNISIETPRCVFNKCLFQYLKKDTKDVKLSLPNIPKTTALEVIDSDKSTTFDDDQEISLKFQQCKINARCTRNAEITEKLYYFVFQLESLNINSCRQNIFFINNLSLNAKVQNKTANLYLILNTINVNLNTKAWPNLDFIKESSPKKEQQNPLFDWNIQICVETWATTGTLSDESSIFCSHVKLILEHSELQWTAELLLESLGWSLSGQNNIDRRVHISGTPLYLAVALVKFSHSMYQGRIDAMLDKLRLEWNSTLMAMVRNQKRSGKSNKSLFGSLIPSNWGINVTFTDLNIFFLLENIAYIATRIDSVVVEGTENKIGVQTTGVKMQDLDVKCASYTCIRSSDIVNYCAYAEAACFDGFYLTNTIYEWKIKILEKITFNWSYLLHMKLVTIYRSFPKREKLNTTSVQVIKKWSVWFNRMSFFAELLTHQMQLDGYEVCIKGPKFRLSSSCLNLFVNQAHVITANTLSLDQSDSNPEVCQERKGAEGLELTKNNAWIFKLALFEAHFPYKHNFADAIQNELVSTFKWLKIIHNKKKVPFTLDSPLPRDLLIKIDECLFEMSDDPFEVRLRDNYELLVDEYKESLKRFQMLGSKVEELRKTHLLLSAGKVEELYANLSTRNAEIYIQRSKKLSSVGPQRTRLLAWRILQLNVIALADLSYHGTERAVNFIQSVNPGSLFPTEGITFSTLWVRTIHVSLKQSTVSLRDFPQPFLEFRGFHTWGKLGGAEATPPPRSVRIVTIDLPAPWSSTVVERGMTQLKFYHDFDMEMEHYSYAFGPCWEPVIAQCNLSLERIFPPSRDPSPPLPFWDKMRLLLHGRLTMLVNHMTVLLHASLDPYNTTEEMELAWSDMALDWTEGKIIVRGDLDIYVRTASKYDDCRLLHLHNLKLTIKLNWVCLSDPNDHHSVIPCAPDKLPEYSSNQEHDSFRAFRSQNIDISISLEAKGQSGEGPSLLLYGSTLRWFESLQLILSGVTRPTRCGLVFGPLRPRRKPLSRHYRKVRILLALQQFQSSYWMSCAMQRGCELVGNRIVCSSEHCLALVPSNDGLIRRPKAVWSIAYMNCEVTDAEVWLKSALQTEQSDSEMPLPVEKFYCLSVEKVSYGRETPLAESRDTPTHRLVVYDLRGAWTKSNRDVAFALLDAYVKSQQLRKNLSAEALRNDGRQKNNDVTTSEPEVETKTSPESVGQQLSPASMLQKLIAEAEHKPVVFSDDQSPAGTQTQLQGLQACKLDDVLHNNWLIALVNAQVVLRGCETKGYVILSAAKAEILQRVHGPAPKRTWVGSLECLQYYATVGAADDDIMWLPVELIQEHGAAGAAGPAAVVGSGRAAGGVVTQIVGAGGRQLQRIVSRCCCEFFYVSYGAADPSGPTSDAFTLMHHDLDICTNSLQYAMLLDVVNSLLLYVEPTRKEAAARLARLRFQLQLRADGSVRVPVQKLQTEVRTYLRRLRQLERDAHLVGESTAAVRIRQQLAEVKTDLAARAEELQMLLAIHRGSAPQTTVRSHEIYFKHAQWRLTDADGQLGIADLVLSNFLYTKNSKSDGSVEHLLELGYIHMTNLLPNQIYSEVLSPTEIQRDMPVDHKHVLRVFCRERPPVGGISVKEHFEVNVLPITIGLTKKFYNTMLKFCFPERDDPDAMQSKVSKDTSFYVRIDQKDDVEKMKERAEKNKLFIYIKIPEVPVRVSYKGNKEKNIEDVRDFSLVIPTLEYHNVTWTWLDLLLAMKNDTRRVILSQAIKQKLQLNRGKAGSVDQNSPQEADKVKMLFGKLSSIK